MRGAGALIASSSYIIMYDDRMMCCNLGRYSAEMHDILPVYGQHKFDRRSNQGESFICGQGSIHRQNRARTSHPITILKCRMSLKLVRLFGSDVSPQLHCLLWKPMASDSPSLSTSNNVCSSYL